MCPDCQEIKEVTGVDASSACTDCCETEGGDHENDEGGNRRWLSRL